jgi:hypothetical protein
MKSQRARLAARIIHVLCMHQEARHTRHRHDLPMVPLRVRHELLYEQEVRDGVYFEDAPDLGCCFCEDGEIGADPGVVD